jgi:hypothetical protein
MAENLTPIKLDEMRPGLFRIHWTSFMEIKKNLSIYTEEFQLSGSWAGCKFKITYHLKSFPSPENNIVTIVITLSQLMRSLAMMTPVVLCQM